MSSDAVATVCSLTGCSPDQAAALLAAFGGNVDAAVSAHFDGHSPAAGRGGGQGGASPPPPPPHVQRAFGDLLPDGSARDPAAFQVRRGERTRKRGRSAAAPASLPPHPSVRQDALRAANSLPPDHPLLRSHEALQAHLRDSHRQRADAQRREAALHAMDPMSPEYQEAVAEKIRQEAVEARSRGRAELRATPSALGPPSDS